MAAARVEATRSSRGRTRLRAAGRSVRRGLVTRAGDSTESVVDWMCSSELMVSLLVTGVLTAAVFALPRRACGEPPGRTAHLHRLPGGNEITRQTGESTAVPAFASGQIG